jgi:hypothetical protein
MKHNTRGYFRLGDLGLGAIAHMSVITQPGHPTLRTLLFRGWHWPTGDLDQAPLPLQLNEVNTWWLALDNRPYTQQELEALAIDALLTGRTLDPTLRTTTPKPRRLAKRVTVAGVGVFEVDLTVKHLVETYSRNTPARDWLKEPSQLSYEASLTNGVIGYPTDSTIQWVSHEAAMTYTTLFELYQHCAVHFLGQRHGLGDLVA